MGKRYLRKWMIGLLCGALIVSNVISTGVQISATEMGTEQAYMDNSQNVVGIIDEADNAPSNNDVESGNSQVDGLEDENEEETTPEELELESQEQEETENEESEGDSAKSEIEDSEKEEGCPDDVEEKASGAKNIVIDVISSLNVEERLTLMTSDDDIASGTYGDIAWVIDANGKLTVEGSGDVGSYLYPKWFVYRDCITSAKINVTDITSTRCMFAGCRRLKSVDFSEFDASNVTDMELMFSECSSLISLNLSNFDTGNVINMRSMFDGCVRVKSSALY